MINWIRKAGGVIGKTQDSIEILYQQRITNKLMDILKDETHPLRPEFDKRLINRSGRFRGTKYRTVRYSESFVPLAVRLYNNSKNRLSQ